MCHHPFIATHIIKNTTGFEENSLKQYKCNLDYHEHILLKGGDLVTLTFPVRHTALKANKERDEAVCYVDLGNHC